jgi:LysR family transcriptional regulator, nitrogen assimilation regulatory protein
MSRMEFRWLRYFVAVAEAGSFSAAARHLGVAQPALSRHIKAAEDRLKAVLLIRSARGVELTEQGEAVYSSAQSILQQLDALPGRVGTQDKQVSGRVAIGIPTSASVVLTEPLILAAMERYPGITIQVTELFSGSAFEWLQSGRLDLAIVYDAPASSSLSIQRLVEEEVWLLGAPSAIAELPVEIRVAELAQLPLVLPAVPHSMRQLINAVALQQGLKLNIVAEADALHAIKAIAASGRAFSILARTAARDAISSGRIGAVRIVEPHLRRTVSLARPLLRGRNRAAEEIGGLCLELAAEFSKKGTWGG